MARSWVEAGLQHAREQAEQLRVAAERRAHQAAVVKDKAPGLMRAVLAEVAAVFEEYRRGASAFAAKIELEELPHEAFCVTRTARPRVDLQCRPSYETQAVYCNLTRTSGPDNEPVERVFSLDFTVDDADNVALREGSQTFPTAAEAVEFLVKPVLFPPLEDHQAPQKSSS
jgi:hypothetical protein